jgi:hypothetical protein
MGGSQHTSLFSKTKYIHKEKICYGITQKCHKKAG